MMAILACRHFRDVGYNPSLWEYMDLGERCVTETEVHSLMNRGIRILRLTHAKRRAESLEYSKIQKPVQRDTRLLLFCFMDLRLQGAVLCFCPSVSFNLGTPKSGLLSLAVK
uniref:Uncharacterized protein n=1 Tax=Parascaris equorum TaxID=6256 RepID=A0A914RY83_PAREQ